MRVMHVVLVTLLFLFRRSVACFPNREVFFALDHFPTRIFGFCVERCSTFGPERR
jgi:hypothetical protein